MHNLSPYTVEKLRNTRILVLACSAGGFTVMFDLLKTLPADLPIAVLVVIHRNARYETNIETTLETQCRLTIKVAEDKEPIRPATVYFAPAGYHVLVEPDHRLSLDISDPVNFCRPSIDVTMQSTADVYGAATMAILLSGANQDGAEGMSTIQKMGGLCIVQHPEDAEIPTMPEAAIARGAVDLVLKNEELIVLSRELNTYILTRDPHGQIKARHRRR